MVTRLKKLFEIKGYTLFIFCMLLIGMAISITVPYLSLYCTEIVGMSAGAFGVLIAVSSLGGVVVNSLIAKRSDSGIDRKGLIISAMFSSVLGYISYLLFHNFFILLIPLRSLMELVQLLCHKSLHMHRNQQMPVNQMTRRLPFPPCAHFSLSDL